MKNKANTTNSRSVLNKAKFDRVLKRIEQGCTTIKDAQFIRELIMTGINPEADGGIRS